MRAHKVLSVVCLTVLTVLTAAGAARCDDKIAEPPLPDISDPQRRFLSALARRTIRDDILGRPAYEPTYIPKALQMLEADVVVRLRQRGFLRAAGVGAPAPVTTATREAARAAVNSLRGSSSPDLELLSRLLIEIEVNGRPVPIPSAEGSSWRRRLNMFVEPGVHGVVVVSAGDARRFCPTEIFTSDILVPDAVEALAKDMAVGSSQMDRLRILRFRTAHWYEEAQSRRIVSLTRGLTPLPEDVVTRRNVDEAILALAKYMMYRQLPSGMFSYQYEPARDVYTDDNNLVRQAGSAVAMALYAAHLGDDDALRSANRALEVFLHNAEDIPGEKEAAFVGTADGRNKLGVTAMICLALARHRQVDRYAPVRRKLVNGILWLQRPSGMFITAFPPAQSIAAQNYFPGEALLALAAHYKLEPSSRVNEAFGAAIKFYRDYFRDRRSPAFVPWQVQAFAEMARQSKRRDYVDYVFEMTDWLAEKQLDRSNCPYPEMWGGVASYSPGRAGVSTASYLEGFTDALALARRVGDKERQARYQRLVSSAARFVMQLQFRPEEAYFVRSPQDAVGGIRTSPSLNLLRIDHCQHALVALIKTRQVLFGDED